MESVESPLDVLSRAATMVQDSLPNGNISPDESSKQVSTKQLPTTKWKRERRRLPEYTRKSDPKLTENMPPELQQNSPNSPVDSSSRTSSISSISGTSSNCSDSPKCVNIKQEAPIDMSVRQRGLPPSYTQAISSPGYRPSVITQAPTPHPLPSSLPVDNVRPGVWNDLPSGISMCDPIIDEHFRRSLGNDYLMLFNNNKTPTEPPAVKKASLTNNRVVSPSSNNTRSEISARELLDIDTAGLSVDDHFAKALGDTWLKLNQKDSDIQQSNGTTEKPTVVSL